MEQKFLDQAQLRINQLKDLEQQVENAKKQVKDKECEISNFKQEWVNNCTHVFYRIQRIGMFPYTVGYHCCLCGKYEKLENSNKTQTQSKPICCRHLIGRPGPEKHSHPKPCFLPPPEETHEFIDTVIDGPFADGKESDEERFPIPPEYQAEVESKKAQLAKLEAELADLVEKLHKLEESVKIFKSDLDSATHLLNNYFGYPIVTERAPVRWTRDDYNYDPFD